MKTAISLVVALTLGAGMASLSAGQQADGMKYEKGASVTLQGCVTAAKNDTYVLTNVREWPAGNSDMGKYGKRYYWIDKAGKDMKAHLGHTIQVIGKISDVTKSEIEFKSGDAEGGMNVEIEGPGRDVVTSAEKAQVDPASRPNKNDIPITLLKVKVDQIKMTAATCNAAM